MEQNDQESQDSYTWYNIHIMRIPEKKTEEKLEIIIVENFLKLMRHRNLGTHAG